MFMNGTLEQNTIIGNHTEMVWWWGISHVQTCVLKNNLILGNFRSGRKEEVLTLVRVFMQIANNVFAANVADSSGGGICIDPNSQATTLKNNIFSVNNVQI